MNKFMRALHRDLGALVIGLTLIFSLSGMTLVFRDKGFMTSDKEHTKELEVALDAKSLKDELELKGFKVLEESEAQIVFKEGTYDKSTGLATYTTKDYPLFLKKFIQLHKAHSKKIYHWVTLTYGVSLFLLAVSSLWMYKPGTKRFKRFILLSAMGASIALIILALI